MDERLILMKGVCCKAWPMLNQSFDRCGRCNKRPRIVGVWDLP